MPVIMPIIPATGKEEIGRITAQGQPWKKSGRAPD
jgi:hypothetical protein